MDMEKIKRVTEDVANFYNNHAEEFSKTRQNPWPGWDKCLEYIKNSFSQDVVSVLDIGCGNGRFYKYLTDFSDFLVYYLGLDNNDYMVLEAVLKYQLAEFKNLNVFLDLDKVEKQYDVVSVFGLTHHLHQVQMPGLHPEYHSSPGLARGVAQQSKVMACR